MSTRVGLLQRLPEGVFVAGAISQYAGAAIAVGLFDELHPATVAWLRVLTAGAVVIAVRRAWRRRWDRSALAWAGAFGTTLAVMNLSFYLALDRLPLGNTVAIEFLGPVAVAALGTRTRRSAAALVAAAAGVALLAEVTPEATVAGVGFALGAAAAWAGYIVLGHRVARMGSEAGPSGIDGLGVGMLIGSMAVAVVGVPAGAGDLGDPRLLVLAMATGVLSNAVPYGLDQVVLRFLPRARFALLQALLPATATVVGLVALAQVPTPAEVAGIAMVIVGLVVAERPAEAPAGA